MSEVKHKKKQNIILDRLHYQVSSLLAARDEDNEKKDRSFQEFYEF